MERTRLAVALASATLVFAGATSLLAQGAPSGAYGFEITVKPQGADGATFTCDATLSDLATGEVLWQPRITARAATDARATGSFTAGGAAYTLLLTVRVEGATVTHAMEVRRDDKAVFRCAGITTAGRPRG